MKIEIWSDFSCPFCYIGKKKLEKALNDFPYKNQVEIIYKSYELNPQASETAEEKGYKSFAKRKNMSLEEAQEIFENVTEMAKKYNLNYNIEKMLMVSTRKAHRLAKWARTKNKEAEFIELAFSAYFEKGLNIADDKTLLKFIKELNLDLEEATEVLNGNFYDDFVSHEINEGINLGLSGVPFFVFDRKFAVSGAQPDELFTKALNKAYQENGKIKTVIKDKVSVAPKTAQSNK